MSQASEKSLTTLARAFPQVPEPGSLPLFRAYRERAQREFEIAQPIPFSAYLQQTLQALEYRQRATEFLERDTGVQNGLRQSVEAAIQSPLNLIPDAATLLYAAVMAYPYTDEQTNPDGRETQNFFTAGIGGIKYFGHPKTTEQLTRLLQSQAKKTPDVEKVILLTGPTGSGKSTLVELLKRGLETYTASSAHPVYTIADCPRLDDPLLLLDHETRLQIKQQYGVTVEGTLCAHCQEKLRQTQPLDTLVQPAKYSTQQGIGIVKIEPGATYGDLNDIKKLLLQGNRGLIELAEIFRYPDNVQDMLLDIVRQRSVVIDGKEFPFDGVIIAHSTYSEWRNFMDGYDYDYHTSQEAQDKRAQRSLAFKKRTLPVILYYPVSLQNEVATYTHKIEKSNLHPHIAPQSLEILAEVARLSRLYDSSEINLDEKRKLYDGEDVGRFTKKDITRIQEEGIQNDEGLFGIPSTDIFDFLFSVMVQNQECVDPLLVFQEITTYLHNYPEENYPLEKQQLEKLLRKLQSEYDQQLVQQVQQAFRGDYEDACQTEFTNYLKQTELFLNQGGFDEQMNEPITADETILRDIEDHVFGPMTEEARESIRKKIFMEVGTLSRKKQEIHYRNFPAFKDPLERWKTGETEEEVNAILTSLLNVPNVQQQERLATVQERLINEYHFCPCCAPKLMKHAARLVGGNVSPTKRR